MAAKITIEVEDVRGSFKRLVNEAPTLAKRFLSTAVFLTAGAVERRMTQHAPLGPDGEGLTPGEHIKFDIEHRGKTGSLSARVGIFDNPAQASVAIFNEYTPDRQPFMKVSAEEESEAFRTRVEAALQQMERALSQGF